MFAEFLSSPVPLWLLLVISLFLFVMGVAVNRKFSMTSGWLTILGTLFTINDIKALAVAMWRAGLIPASVQTLRFHDNESEFANYLADMVLKFLPEIGRVEEAIAQMSGTLPDAMPRGMVGIYENSLHLEGRGLITFVDKRGDGRGSIPGWPLIDKVVAPPESVEQD